MSCDTAESVSAQIASQGALVKALKLSGKTNDDPDVSSAVSHLKQLKAKLAELTGVEEIVGGREKKKKKGRRREKTSTIVDEQRDEERDETGDARRDQRRFRGVVFPSRRRSGTD